MTQNALSNKTLLKAKEATEEEYEKSRLMKKTLNTTRREIHKAFWDAGQF